MVLGKMEEMRAAVARGGDVHRNHNRPGKCIGCSRREGCPERLAHGRPGGEALSRAVELSSTFWESRFASSAIRNISCSNGEKSLVWRIRWEMQVPKDLAPTLA